MTCIGWLPYGAAFSADLLSGHLNPIRPKTYKVIQGIYNQVLPLFKDKYVHGEEDERQSTLLEQDRNISPNT